jgi:hypothetical protein
LFLLLQLQARPGRQIVAHGDRSCESIPAKAKAFRAEAQSRIEHKENKAVVYFNSLRLCVSARVQLFFHSFTAVGKLHLAALQARASGRQNHLP